MPPRKRPRLAVPQPAPTMHDYVEAFCDAPLTRKAVIDLSAMLARVVGGELQAALPGVDVKVGHRWFGGSNRRHHLDTFVANEHYGLQLGVDVKGLNSGASVGKNWNNRIGDLHELATNHHQHAPKAVMGGVFVIPYEDTTANTRRNIEEAVLRLGGRRAIANSVNLFECAVLVVISKEERRIVDSIPDPAAGHIRIEGFAAMMAEVFRQRWR